MFRVLMSILAILSMVVVGYSSSLFAESQRDGQKDRRSGGGPPRAAIKVCEGKSIGDKVEFKTPRGQTVMAECKLIALPIKGRRPRNQNSDSNQQRPPRQNQDDGRTN